MRAHLVTAAYALASLLAAPVALAQGQTPPADLPQARPSPEPPSQPPAEPPTTQAPAPAAPAPAAPPAPTVEPPAPAEPPVLLPPAQPVTAEPVALEQPSKPARDQSWDFWQIGIGSRVSWIPNEGFDPFSNNNALGHLSISASRALLRRGDASLAAGLVWEPGWRESTARGASSSLNAQRLGAMLEGRFHFAPTFYGLVKTVPQAVYVRTSLDDSSAGERLEQTTWRFGVDATVGAAWDFAHTIKKSERAPGFWLTGEFGYGWTMSRDLVLEPDVDDDDPQADIALDLGSLALRGLMMRIGVAVTF